MPRIARLAPLPRIASALAVSVVLIVAALHVRSADQVSPSPPVAARPPLEAVPVNPLSKQAQQRIRQCNARADAQKLEGTRREGFVKSCMAPPPRAKPAHPRTSP